MKQWLMILRVAQHDKQAMISQNKIEQDTQRKQKKAGSSPAFVSKAKN